LVAARHELLSLCDAIGEVRGAGIELPHPSMQPRERNRIVGWCDLWRHRWVVGPQRDHKAVTLVDTRRRSRFKRSHWAPDLGEPLCQLDFELRHLLRERRHSGKHVARQQAHSELVRVLKNDCVVDGQVKR
jgi:hypothetical protein